MGCTPPMGRRRAPGAWVAQLGPPPNSGRAQQASPPPGPRGRPTQGPLVNETLLNTGGQATGLMIVRQTRSGPSEPLTRTDIPMTCMKAALRAQCGSGRPGSAACPLRLESSQQDVAAGLPSRSRTCRPVPPRGHKGRAGVRNPRERRRTLAPRVWEGPRLRHQGASSPFAARPHLKTRGRRAPPRAPAVRRPTQRHREGVPNPAPPPPTRPAQLVLAMPASPGGARSPRARAWTPACGAAGKQQ